MADIYYKDSNGKYLIKSDGSYMRGPECCCLPLDCHPSDFTELPTRAYIKITGSPSPFPLSQYYSWQDIWDTLATGPLYPNDTWWNNIGENTGSCLIHFDPPGPGYNLAAVFSYSYEVQRVWPDPLYPGWYTAHGTVNTSGLINLGFNTRAYTPGGGLPDNYHAAQTWQIQAQGWFSGNYGISGYQWNIPKDAVMGTHIMREGAGDIVPGGPMTMEVTFE